MDTRKIDAALAKHLFEWTDVHVEAAGEGKQEVLFGRVPGQQWPPKVVPHYSTTGDGMLMVVEAMNRKGYRVDVAFYADGKSRFLVLTADPWKVLHDGCVVLTADSWKVLHDTGRVEERFMAAALAALKIVCPDALKELENG